MKKFISILLVLVIGLFAFTACNKDDTNNPSADGSEVVPVEKFDGEKLKETWTAGEITLADGDKILLPCTVKEFLEISGLSVGNEQLYAEKQYKPGETLDIQLAGNNTRIKIECENLGNSDEDYLDTTVVGFSFFNSANGNRAITVAAGLTVGITRAEVEGALGIPEGKTSEDKLYTYKSKIGENQEIRMNVTFNSDGIVNSISYKVNK